jgi:hypothetical protein
MEVEFSSKPSHGLGLWTFPQIGNEIASGEPQNPLPASALKD